MTRSLRMLGALLTALALTAVGLTHAPWEHAAPAGPAAAAEHDHDHDCHPLPPVEPGAPPACGHEDEPPPGVDVHRKVPTAELRARVGARRAAVRAAQDAGVATAASTASTATSTVTCDGDGTGTDGYRVQAIYAYEQGATSRYASMKPSIQQWAAGVDTVFNRSAAMTGGVRSVRWVTVPDGAGGCVASVLEVQIPLITATTTTALDENGLSQLPAALKALGYNDPHRKYLVWADANVLCGIAQLYGDGTIASFSTPLQTNTNNGAYPMYGRVDTGCWGNAQSVEAHELTHMLGAVLTTAPHPSDAGHCSDESDRMCYQDGATLMRQVCPAEDEVLLDCNGDDYFSTLPATGSWLAMHWNTANSRFLVGGGGTSSGTTRVDVLANTAPAGLPAQLSATVTVPTGSTYALTWATTTAGCVLGDESGTQASLRCLPGTAAAAVTTTLTASTGVTAQHSFTVPFDQTPRVSTVSLSSGGASAVTTCLPVAVPLQVTVTDTATGVGVYGARVDEAAGSTSLGTVVTGVDGTVSTAPTLSTAAYLTAKVSATQPTWAGATSAGPLGVTDTCGTGSPPPLPVPAVPLIGSSTAALVGTGVVAVAGSVSASGHALAGAPVSLVYRDGLGRTRVAANSTTTSTGAYTLRGTVSYSGTLRVQVAATATTLAAVSPARTLVVHVAPLARLSATTARRGSSVTLYATTNPARASRVLKLQRYYAGHWSTIGGITTDRYGRGHVVLAQRSAGYLYYRWYTGADALNAAGIGPMTRLHVL